MKKHQLLLALGLTLGLTGAAYAGTPCDGTPGDTCELPAPNGTAPWTQVGAIGIDGISCFNAGSPPGNLANSRYYFAASTSNLGNPVNHGGITTTGTGSEVIGNFKT